MYHLYYIYVMVSIYSILITIVLKTLFWIIFTAAAGFFNRK